MISVVLMLGLGALAAPAAQQRGAALPLTGDAALDSWVIKTFGQPVDREALADPVWGTNTLASLSQEQREGARLFMNRSDRAMPRCRSRSRFALELKKPTSTPNRRLKSNPTPPVGSHRSFT